MRKLTRREKILIYIAVILLLLTGGYYLVKIPSDRVRLEMESRLEILKLQNNGGKLGRGKVSGLETAIDQELAYLKAHRDDYLPYRSNSVLIPEITTRLTFFGISPESMEIVETSILEETEPEGGYGIKKKAEEAKGYTIHKASVHIKAVGTKASFYELLDWADETDWISITAYSMADRRMTGTDSVASKIETEEYFNITMTIICMMLEVDEGQEFTEGGR